MEITHTQQGNVVVAVLDGRLDATTCGKAQDQLNALIDAEGPKLVLDLERLQYVSSAGLRVFLFVAKKLQPLGGRLVLARAGDQINDVLKISGFATLFPNFPTLAEATAAAGK